MTVTENSGGSASTGTAQTSVQEKSESPKQRHVSRMGSGNFVRGNSLTRRTAGRLKVIDEVAKQEVTPDLVCAPSEDCHSMNSPNPPKTSEGARRHLKSNIQCYFADS